MLAACLLPFFFGPHRKGFIDFRGSGNARFLFEFFDALLGRFQFLQRRFQLALLRHDDVDQAIHADASRAHVLFELLDGVHAENLSNRQPRSCASLSNCVNGQTPILVKLRQKIDSNKGTLSEIQSDPVTAPLKFLYSRLGQLAIPKQQILQQRQFAQMGDRGIRYLSCLANAEAF